MRKITYSSEVHASYDTIWKIMVDRVEQPQGMVPDVTDSRVLQRYDNGVLREVRTGRMAAKEKVVLDKSHGEIHFFMIDHPLFSGRIIHRLTPTSVQNPVAPQMLTFEMHWTAKDQQAEKVIESEMPARLKDEVLALKAQAEGLDRGGSEKRTNYAFGRVISLPFAQTLRRVRDALQREGFGVLTEIDVRQKFRVKLQKEFRNYVILGACVPPLAYQALGVELEVGVLLPCNVVVFEVEEGMSEVMAMDPAAALSVVGNPRLSDIAGTVKGMLERVISSL